MQGLWVCQPTFLLPFFGSGKDVCLGITSDVRQRTCRKWCNHLPFKLVNPLWQSKIIKESRIKFVTYMGGKSLPNIPAPVDTYSPFFFSANVGLNCNFELNLCTWKQDTTDQFDWRRQLGSTASSSTGPSVDHTTGTSK